MNCWGQKHEPKSSNQRVDLGVIAVVISILDKDADAQVPPMGQVR